MHTLISFLGQARKDQGEQYRTTNYNFGSDIKTTQFLGERIQPQQDCRCD